MSQVTQSGAGPILLACRNHLIAQLNYLTASPTLCVITAKDMTPALGEGQDVVLRLGSYISRPEHYDGAGRTHARFHRFLHMYPRVRLALDETGSDLTYLTHPTLGQLAWEEACANALIGFTPIDSSGNQLTECELRLADGTDPVRGRMDQQWGESSITFEIEYAAILNSTPWYPPLITTTSLPAATASVAYSTTLSVISPLTVGTAPYTWTTPTTLPSGITLSTGGTLSGTTTATGSTPIIFVVTDANGQRAAAYLTLTVS